MDWVLHLPVTVCAVALACLGWQSGQRVLRIFALLPVVFALSAFGMTLSGQNATPVLGTTIWWIAAVLFALWMEGRRGR